VICSSCGTENRSGAKFCVECATPLSAACPSCGAGNPPGAKFCEGCATPLGATATIGRSAAGGSPTAERRLVSVLFADLVGFTPFAADQDPEQVRETLSRYFDIATQVIERYGGTVEKFIGDAVMAVWGTPIAHEDDAERAVRAALELVDAVQTMGPEIQARCGVLTGEAAVTIGATNQGMVAGDLVNTASRLQGAALPGTVLVGEATQRAAAQSIVFEAVDDQTLKGKTSPVQAWRAMRVVAERGGRGRSDALEAPFVGRDEELRQLKDLFHATGREGRARLVSVIGPGGIGKTRLAWEFLKYVDGLVEQVWWHDGRSPAYGDGVTFWALGEMIRGRAGLLETDDEATTRTRIAAMLQEHVPDPEERTWIEAALLALLGFEVDVGSEQLFGAWRTFFERLAASGPVVMVFEDLHHADLGLLDFIDHLLDWSRTAPITIITLARRELLDRRPDWGVGKRSFTSFSLEPLPPEAMRELLGGLVPGLPAATTEAIVARADGVPLYAVETVRMLLSQGSLVLEDGVYRPTEELDQLAVPETLAALIAARLDGLDATDRALVADAAVLGQTFTPDALAAVAGITADGSDQLETRLAGLVKRELLVQRVDPRSPERGQYAFVQALIREVAYNTLAKADRKTRHLAAARYFEALGSDELAGALAGHYLAAQQLATDAGEADALAAQARLALRGAAERAASLGSHDQAITFLEQALAVTRDEADRADLHRRALASALQGLDGGEAERHAVGVVEALRSLGDREAIAKATAEHGYVVLHYFSRPDRALAVLLPGWEEFSDLEETPAGVSLMRRIGVAYSFLHETATAMQWCDRFLPIAERLDLLEDSAAGLSLRGSLLIRLNRPREGLVLIRGANQLARTHDLPLVDRQSRTLLTFYLQFEDPAEGLAQARDGQAIARRQSSLAYGFLMVGNAFSCALRVGDWDWASALLEEWISMEISGNFALELYVDRAVLTALRGGDPTADISQAATMVTEVKDQQYESYLHWARAWAAMVTGRFSEVREEAALAVRSTEFFSPIILPLAARAALWAGDSAGANAILAELVSSGYRGQAVGLDVATLRAGVAALEGRRAESAAAYREVLRGWRHMELAFDESLAALDLAILLDPAEPDLRALIDTARETLRRLGAEPLLAKLDTAAARVDTVAAKVETPAAEVLAEEAR
jgi:class 3 adenylate cyclase/tetratricopeptide (TPR) repeat protein